MSLVKFGERYFVTRERISQVIHDIKKLASDTKTELGETISLASFTNDLCAPFLFVVSGEVNAGKSSLINGLFGRELCTVNILPETDQVIWYRYGAPPRDVSVVPSLEERYRPIEILRDFNLVDTPGTNSIVKGHQEITERFLPVADLVLFVFPVTNPWGAATWNLISRLPVECHPRIVFIIQQADQRSADDLKVILQHMSDLSFQRIGIVPRIFPVSAKLALSAKRAGGFGEKDYAKSGFAELEDFISKRVCDSPDRLIALQNWRNHAANALRKIEDSIEQSTRVLGQQHHFLESLEHEIDSMRESLVARLPSHLSGVAEVFEKEAVGVSASLSKNLNLLPSIFRVFFGDRTGSETEALFIERLGSAVEKVAEIDGKDVVSACLDHWSQLGPRVHEAVGIEIETRSEVEEKLDQARIRFVNRIARAAQNGIGNLHLRKDLEREIRRRNLALKSFTATALLFIIFGAIAGILEFFLLPFIACAIALAFTAGGIYVAITTKARISQEFQQALLNTCGTFAETLRGDYEEALRIVFQDYTTCLNSVRKHLVKDKLAIAPRLQRWHDLFLTLKSIEQDS